MVIPESMREFTGLTAITVMFLLAGSLLIFHNSTVSRKARNAFLASTITLMCIALADCLCYLTDGKDPGFAALHTALLVITFCIAPAIPILIANTVSPQRYVKWAVILLVIHAAFQLASIPGGWVFWVDAANTYHRGPLYPVYMAAYSASALYLVVESIKTGRAYQAVRVSVVFAILACMLTGVLIQVFDTTVRTTWPAVSMAVMLYFMFYSDMVLRNDVLTKLLNRRSYRDALEKPPLPFVAVVIDVDNFKGVNDTYGHAFGDECLARVAQMIRRSYGSAGLCYRTGGDEFAVIVTRDLDGTESMKEKLIGLAETARRNDGRMPGMSVGSAFADESCKDAEAVFRSADHAMYLAKKSSPGHQAQKRI